MTNSWIIPVSLSLLTCMAACTSSRPDDDDGGAGAASNVETHKASITPMEGGTLSDPSGAVTLTVPAGAVSQVIEVSLEVRAATPETISKIYVFEPNGTTFDLPATLRFSTEGLSPPADTAVTLAALDDGRWVASPDVVEGSGGFEAAISVLGTFAIVADEPKGGLCDASCMSQPGAECCTTCGCEAEVFCMPSCSAPFTWDCEIGCCFDYDAFACEGA